jgi:hypothetical protein
MNNWNIFLLILFILWRILYPIVCEILFSNLYLDLIEFEINYNYNYNLPILESTILLAGFHREWFVNRYLNYLWAKSIIIMDSASWIVLSMT